MIEVNKPEDTTPNVRCYKCKTEFYVPPQESMNSAYVTNCEFHKPKCEHESDGSTYCRGFPYFVENIRYKCKKCGEFYR